MQRIILKNKDGKSYYSLMPRKNYNYFIQLVRQGYEIETAYNMTITTESGKRYKGKIPNLRMADGRLFMDVAKELNFNFNDCAIFRRWNKKLGNPEKALEKVFNNIARRKAAWEKYRMTEENIF